MAHYHYCDGGCPSGTLHRCKRSHKKFKPKPGMRFGSALSNRMPCPGDDHKGTVIQTATITKPKPKRRKRKKR